MSETLTIKGERFTGNLYEGYWYEGAGIIEDWYKREKHFFALQTSHFRNWLYDTSGNYTLEESIVNYNQRGPFYAGDFKPQLAEGAYRKIVDISLGEMVSQVRQSKEDISVVEPKRLEVEYLIMMGYCADRSGQLNFQFSA